MLKLHFYLNWHNHILHKSKLFKIVNEIVLIFRRSAQENRGPPEGFVSIINEYELLFINLNFDQRLSTELLSFDGVFKTPSFDGGGGLN